MTGEVRSPHEASLQLREVLQVATAHTIVHDHVVQAQLAPIGDNRSSYRIGPTQT
jgi:hypothetical protein